MVAAEESVRHPPVPDETLEKVPVPPDRAMDEEEEKDPPPEGEGKVSGGGEGEEEEKEEEEEEEENDLALADELFEKGSSAIEVNELDEAVDCLSRALEIRVAHHGELAFECATSYYKYGCALLYKAQEEADPLGNVPKNNPSKSSSADTTVKVVDESASSKAAVNSKEEGQRDKAQDEDGRSEVDDEDLADEDDSDLDLAWKMLDIARAIVDKHGEDTLEKVKILSALGEASLEREDFETSLTDYHMGLSILEKLVERDHRRIIELNFRICLVLEVASRTEEAAKYCKKSIELCKSRLQRLREEVANIKDSTSAVTDVPDSSNLHGRANEPLGVSVSEKEEEIELIGGFQGELEIKLQDLQHAISNPKSVLSEVLMNIASANLPHGDKNLLKMEDGSASSASTQKGACGGFDTPAASTNGAVTHLGVVGRGVKRASAVPITGEPGPKRSSLDPSAPELPNLNSTRKDPEIPK